MPASALPATDGWRFAVPTPATLETAAAAVASALAQRKFSVLWEVDLHEKLREKGLSVEGRYRILEVCSAPRAKEALEINPEVAAFLPCKVVVVALDGRTEIRVPRPTALIGLLADPRLQTLAEEVEAVLVDAAREAAAV